MNYKVTYTDKFKERLEELDKSPRKRTKKKIKEFKRQVNKYNIDPRQHNNTKFISKDRVWRLRIGDYRAFFDILGDEIKFLTVHHRKKAYKK